MLKTLRPKKSSGILVVGQHQAIVQSILDFDHLCGRESSIVAIITQNKKAEKYFLGSQEVLIPCYPHVDNLSRTERTRVEWMLNVQSGRRAFASTVAFFDAFPQALGGHLFAENVPEQHATELIKRYGDKLLLGPSGVGLLVPGFLKLGAIGGVDREQLHTADVVTPGTIAVGCTSGGMTNELIRAVIAAGHHLSFAACIGGDRFPITSLTRLFELAEADKQTKGFVYFGELGGVDEYEIIDLMKRKKFTKPLVAYIAGVIDDVFGGEHVQFGHAKALVQQQNESARAKRDALRQAGAIVPETFPEFLQSLKKLPTLPARVPLKPLQSLMPRQRTILSTRQIVRHGNAQKNTTFTHAILEALLGKPVKSKKTIVCAEHIFQLLIDHGGNVSGAVNTMITARAGKDLVSSLASGLLTIGPRFGGAINQAALTWLNGVDGTHPAEGSIIPGIGHKKYRLGLPDPRVEQLAKLVKSLKKHPHYDFARHVEKITTAKNGSLILNIDGMIAALLLDVLTQEENMSPAQLRALAEAEFFNAFFIIPRTVGFIGHFLYQKQNDEGLFRLPDELLFTQP